MKTKALVLLNPQHSSARALTALIFGLALIMAQTLAAHARAAPASFADLFAKVSPAVVNITTTTTIAASASPRMTAPKGSPFEKLFRDFLDQQNGQNGQNSPTAPNAPRRAIALGSGFIISKDGFIVTNNHVIADADEVSIELFNGGNLKARVVGVDLKTDIALLKVDSKTPLPFVQFGNSDMSRVGDWVMAMGNPLGQGFSISAGIISARNRALRGTYDDFIQTDAAINRGNSGGPLFNMDGDVIGVNTAILSPNGGGSIGIGFSMSSAVVSKVVAQLQKFGETRRGWLGVRIQDVSPDMADALSLADAAGAMVTNVPDGPAKIAGILQGDVIVTFDGKHVADTRELVRMVGNTAVGKTVDVIVYREGKNQTVKVVLTRRETAEAAQIVPAKASPVVPPVTKKLLGLDLQGLSSDLRSQLGLGDNIAGIVVMNVDETSAAFEKGLRAGDIITEAGQQKIASVAELETRVKHARDAGRKSLLLLVRRDGEPRFVALTLGS
jgi:serine protease Do